MAILFGARIPSITGKAGLLACALWLLPGGAFAGQISASDFDAFWLWAGVRPQEVLKDAREIFLLAGEVRSDSDPHIISQRSAMPRIRGSKVWVVFRCQTMRWDENIMSTVVRRVKAWEQAGNNVEGLQIDFDSGTRHLDRYVAFLGTVRSHLPPRFKLGVTGLLDWTANGDPEHIRALGSVVDEVIVQTYQGRQVITGYDAYLAKLAKLQIPFRVGLLQGGDWTAPVTLSDNPHFKGYVVFLLNGKP